MDSIKKIEQAINIKEKIGTMLDEEQVEVRGRMRAHQSLYETAYSHATMYGVTPELRHKTEIRGHSTQFLSSAPG